MAFMKILLGYISDWDYTIILVTYLPTEVVNFCTNISKTILQEFLESFLSFRSLMLLKPKAYLVTPCSTFGIIFRHERF